MRLFALYYTHILNLITLRGKVSGRPSFFAVDFLSSSSMYPKKKVDGNN